MRTSDLRKGNACLRACLIKPIRCQGRHRGEHNEYLICFNGKLTWGGDGDSECLSEGKTGEGDKRQESVK